MRNAIRVGHDDHSVLGTGQTVRDVDAKLRSRPVVVLTNPADNTVSTVTVDQDQMALPFPMPVHYVRDNFEIDIGWMLAM